MPRVLITGAAKRIGARIARCFADAGYGVVLHCNKSIEDARRLLEELGGEAKGHRVVQCDLRDLTATSQLLPKLKRQSCLPDCLVNNASVFSRIPLLEATPEIVEACLAVNFQAAFELMRSFAENVPSGNVINMLDQRVAFTDPGAGPYALAKRSLRDATEACALAWAPKIRVNGVAPGIVMPPPGGSWEKMNAILPQVPMQQRSTEDEIADACLSWQNLPRSRDRYSTSTADCTSWDTPSPRHSSPGARPPQNNQWKPTVNGKGKNAEDNCGASGKRAEADRGLKTGASDTNGVCTTIAPCSVSEA